MRQEEHKEFLSKLDLHELWVRSGETDGVKLIIDNLDAQDFDFSNRLLADAFLPDALLESKI